MRFSTDFGEFLVGGHYRPAFDARPACLRGADLAVWSPEFRLAIFFSEPFLARGACETLLVVRSGLRFDALSNKYLCAFATSVRATHYRMTGLAVSSILEWEVSRAESNFASVAPETTVVPVMVIYVRHLPAKRPIASAALVIGPPGQVGALPVAAIQAVGLPVFSFCELSVREI